MSATDLANSPAQGDPNHGHWRPDIMAGFLVFLIAMPLCLAIAKASYFPPIAGIWTAVIGGIVCTLISNAQMTIKGPAAGLIVIVAGAVQEFGKEFGAGLPEHEQLMIGYRLTLGIGVVSGVIQVLFGLFRIGKLGEFFPLAAVHGLLASIGIIIIAKQLYPVFGIEAPKGGPIMLLTQFPGSLPNLNPEIAIIGVASLVILFGLPWVPSKFIRRVPGPLVVLLIAIPLGMRFDLEHEHLYLFPNGFFDTEHYDVYDVGPRFLVDMPEVIFNPSSAFALPDFRGVFTQTGLMCIVMFSLIGSLESLLSAKAIELIDPYRRKTDFDRDLTAVGVANVISSAVGGLPMISEIVRSRANIDNGARTRWANFFHGMFLLGFVLLLPNLIHRIPNAALGSMLVYTGFRLASPKEFIKTYHVGRAQLLIFLTTIVVTLSTDLLIGIFSGVGLKFILHWVSGAEFRHTFKPAMADERVSSSQVRIRVTSAAVFSNWLSLKAAIERESASSEVLLDLSTSCLVDHTVMEKLHELEIEMKARGRRLLVTGLEEHAPVSRHPRSTRRKRKKRHLQPTPTE